MNENQNASSITRQLQAVFGISIIILLISSFASFYTSRKLIESSNWVNHTNDVLLNTERLYATIREAEAGQRGYLLTRDSNYLKPYVGAHERTLKVYARLRTLTADNEVQQQNLARAGKIIEDRYKQLEYVIKIKERGLLASHTEQLIDSEGEMEKGRRIMDELRTLVDEIKLIERKLLDKRLSQQQVYTTYTPVMVLIAALISIVITMLAYFRIKKDLDARIKKQKEEQELYIQTGRRISHMESVTDKIASGNYAVRSADTAKDELGRISAALNNMAASLETNFTELERRNWLQTGMVKISDAVRGERFVRNLAGKLVKTIAGYINAPVATFYMVDNNENLKLYSAFADNGAPAEIPAGKGLAGQAVRSRHIIVSDELPPNYLRISSSIGHTDPVFVVVLPLVQADAVVGVMELGLLHKPTEREIAFLNANAESIAISVSAAVNYERMQDLLEETQAQAEELQAQHSELENINAELEVQTEKLQASEEELRVQQEELQQANQELEERSRVLEERNHLIAEKNIEVQRKAEELALSTKYKSEFLANMSHELRTPLNSILLLSRLLAENSAANLNEDQVEYARVIQSSGNGLLALIDEILDLSKIEAGKMQLEFMKVSLVEVADNMRAMFEPMARERGLELKINIAPDTPELIETDRLRLEQVVKNLLSNSLKFTREGSVTLAIENNRDREHFINISVTDTGIGIPADKQRLIFEAFQQADGSTRRKYGGTGLGLSISKELSRLLGGDIYLKSTPNKGSTFTITVPVSPEFKLENGEQGSQVQPDEDDNHVQEDTEVLTQPQQHYEEYLSATIPAAIPDDRTNVTPNDKVILIVEDDTGFAMSLLDFTHKKGYKGIVSVRGDEGVELAKLYKPMGVLLDITLPVKSGWQVMEELKRDPATRHIPVHIMSSHSVKKESLMKGAINFINKPVAMEQMQEVFGKLEHVLSRTTKKVLIVEENPQHAKALAYFLETFNINTDIKNSVGASVQALKSDTDCVILDMGVPDSNAYRMLEEIKQDPKLENLPIIVFTGKNLSMNEEAKIKQYADSIVVKTAHSYQRILDEVSLFLHVVEEGKKERKDEYRKLGALADVLKDKTVLVVDDDVRNIFSLTKALEKVQMNIVTAIDGKEAIEKLSENKSIDVVLLDMMMPQMDGYETARAIRANREWKSLPVIAVTAKAMTGDREKCIQAGASDYITKPVDIDQLLSLLRVWLYERI